MSACRCAVGLLTSPPGPGRMILWVDANLQFSSGTESESRCSGNPCPTVVLSGTLAGAISGAVVLVSTAGNLPAGGRTTPDIGGTHPVRTQVIPVGSYCDPPELAQESGVRCAGTYGAVQQSSHGRLHWVKQRRRLSRPGVSQTAMSTPSPLAHGSARAADSQPQRHDTGTHAVEGRTMHLIGDRLTAHLVVRSVRLGVQPEP
jgi:hypothetical protein